MYGAPTLTGTNFTGVPATSLTGAIPTANLPAATTIYIWNTSTLQSGSTAYPNFLNTPILGVNTSSMSLTGPLTISATQQANIVQFSTSPTGVQLVSVSSTPANTPSSFELTVSSLNAVPIIQISNSGHFVSSGTTPTAGTCGTGPTIVTGSTDISGAITWGGAATSCAVNFGVAHGIAPFVIATSTGPAVGISYPPSTTAFTANFTSITGGTITWHAFDGKGSY